MLAIKVSGITKRFGAYTALDGVDLGVQSGELLALLGPSGSGKTTLLRIMAGLDFADSGSVLLNGTEATGLGPRDRGVGFVFQHYSLFRHMTVFDNVAFGLTVRPAHVRPAKSEIADRVNKLLKLVQLEWLADRYPSQLSGGQRQRVALARALAVEPKVLLLDEPFGALDAKVRKELRRWLRHLHEEIHITSVFVTHDQEEALELADRVVVMSQGRIEQVGTPTDVYDHPASPFVYDFLGNVNRIECEVNAGIAQTNGVPLPLSSVNGLSGPAVAFVRPHDVEIVAQELGSNGGDDATDARVNHVHVIGPTARIELNLAGHSLEALVDRERLRALGLMAGDRCRVRLPQVRLFARDGKSELTYEI